MQYFQNVPPSMREFVRTAPPIMRRTVLVSVRMDIMGLLAQVNKIHPPANKLHPDGDLRTIFEVPWENGASHGTRLITDGLLGRYSPYT
jgi:hypothetical protein